MLMQTLCKKGMKKKKAVNTLNLYLPFLTFHDGSYQARIQQASAKLRNVFVKALLWC